MRRCTPERRLYRATLGRLRRHDSVATRLLDVMERDILPMTERGVAAGNKVFGAALLRKSDCLGGHSQGPTAKPKIRCCTARSAR